MQIEIFAYSDLVTSDKASARVRQRLRDELRSRGISQRELADTLSKQTSEFWTQSKVQKVLTGVVELKVDDVEAIAKVAGIFLSEAVRDRGLEFYAEMSPTELRVLERLRKKPETIHGLMMLLDMAHPANLTAPVTKRRKRGRPLTSELHKKPA